MTLLVVWLSCFLGHVYSHFYISHSSWHNWVSLLYIILFVSTYCPFCYIPIFFILSLPSLCRYEWYTCYLHDCLVHDCSYYVWCMSCLSMWDTHPSPYLQLPGLGRPCYPWSHIWYQTCYFVCSLIELMIHSRV